jgi:plastocyanin
MLSVGQSTEALAKKRYTHTGREAALSGRITISGNVPKPLFIDQSADPVCSEANPDARTEWVVANKGMLANVFIYVKGEALQAYTFDLPSSPAMLEHKGCRYEPHMLGMRVGQQLEIFNRDSTMHNTHAMSQINSDWNQTHPPETPPLKHTFQQPEILPFKDNQHPWEKAYVGVFDHPFFSVSDMLGSYRIGNLPPGNYTVVAWHERLGEKTMEVTLVPGEARDVSFNFESKPK